MKCRPSRPAMASNLSAIAGKRLAERLVEFFTPQQHREAIAASMFGSITLQQVADFLALAYRQQQFAMPESAELEQLARLLEQVEHRALQLLHALWSGNAAGARTILAGESEAAYNQYVRIFLTYHVGSPVSLIVQPYAQVFVQQYLSLPQRPYPEVDKIIAALAEMKAESALGALTPALEHSGQESLQAILKYCRTNKSVPNSFRQAVQAQLSAGGGDNLVQRLLGRFTGKK